MCCNHYNKWKSRKIFFPISFCLRKAKGKRVNVRLEWHWMVVALIFMKWTKVKWVSHWDVYNLLVHFIILIIIIDYNYWEQMPACNYLCHLIIICFPKNWRNGLLALCIRKRDNKNDIITWFCVATFISFLWKLFGILVVRWLFRRDLSHFISALRELSSLSWKIDC